MGTLDRDIRIFDRKTPKEPAVVLPRVHMAALTELLFDPKDNNRLFSSGRKDDCIYLWDLRKTDTFLGYVSRPNNLNQRMFMDIQKDTLLTGDHHGHIRMHSICPSLDPLPTLSFQATPLNLTNVLFYGDHKVITA